MRHFLSRPYATKLYSSDCDVVTFSRWATLWSVGRDRERLGEWRASEIGVTAKVTAAASNPRAIGVAIAWVSSPAASSHASAERLSRPPALIIGNAASCAFCMLIVTPVCVVHRRSVVGTPASISRSSPASPSLAYVALSRRAGASACCVVSMRPACFPHTSLTCIRCVGVVTVHEVQAGVDVSSGCVAAGSSAALRRSHRSRRCRLALARCSCCCCCVR